MIKKNKKNRVRCREGCRKLFGNKGARGVHEEKMHLAPIREQERLAREHPMKITYPKEKRKINLAKDGGIIYILLGRGMGSRWWLQDFWRIPYTFDTYADALAGRKKMARLMEKHKWDDPKPVIAKISL